MKRLIKKAEPITIYHGTNLLSLDEILATGISAGRMEDSAWNSTTPTQTFYTTTISRAIFYGQQKHYGFGSQKKDCVVVLEINFDTDYLEPDNDDVPHAKTWQESNQAEKQVAVSGSVTANQIQNLYFYDPLGFSLFEMNPSDYMSNKESVKKKISELVVNDFADKLNPLEEDILDQVSHMNRIITKCYDLFWSTSIRSVDQIEGALEKKHKTIEQLIEKTNQLIKKYNKQENNNMEMIHSSETLISPYDKTPQLLRKDETENEKHKFNLMIIHWGEYQTDVDNSTSVLYAIEKYFKEKNKRVMK